MKTIAIDATRIAGEDTGIGVYGTEIIKHFANHPFFCAAKWVVFCTTAGYKILRKASPGNNNGVKYIVLKGYKHPVLCEQIGMALAIKETADIDVIHSIGYPSTLFLPSRLPLTMTVHDISFIDIPSKIGLIEKFYWNSIFPRNIKRARRVICDSEFSRRQLLKYFPECSAAFVPLGVDHEVYRPLVDTDKYFALEAMEKFKLPRQYCLMVGATAARKNLEIVIEAWISLCKKEKINNITLVLAGGMNAKMKKNQIKWREYIEKKWLSFTGYLNLNDLSVLCRAAKMFIHPAVYEGFGMPILESMACGVPPLVLDQEPMSWLVQEKELLVKKNTQTEWENMIMNYLNNSICTKHRVSVLKRANDFSWLKTAKETYTEIVGAI